MSTEINIRLNGEPYGVPKNSSLEHLVEALNLGNERFAIEVNMDIIPRSEHASYRLQSDDQVEIVQAIGGG